MNDFNDLMGNYAKIAEMSKMLGGKNADVQSVMKAMGYNMPIDTDLLSKVNGSDPMQLASLLKGFGNASVGSKPDNAHTNASSKKNAFKGDFNAYIYELYKKSKDKT